MKSKRGERPSFAELYTPKLVTVFREGYSFKDFRADAVAGLRDERVVAALPVRGADRVHRRQVDDVEAELGELRQHPADTLEAAPAAREELVPGAEAGALALDVDLERLVEAKLDSGWPDIFVLGEALLVLRVIGIGLERKVGGVGGNTVCIGDNDGNVEVLNHVDHVD